MTAARDESGSPNRPRRLLLEQLLREDVTNELTIPPDETIGAPGDAFPLTSAQERLWFLEQLQPATAAFNLPVIWHFDVAIDVDALRWSLDQLLERHAVLRTSFSIDNGQPMQRVDGGTEFQLEVVDLREILPDERDEAAERYVTATLNRPFDLAVGAPIRAVLIRIRWSRSIFVLVVHHIVCDGWSLDVVCRELRELYSAKVDGLSPPPDELPTSYRQFAWTQRAWLRSEAARRQLDYWVGRLAGVEPFDVPADRPRPANQSGDGAFQSVALDAAASASFADLCREEGVTPFMALLGAYGALLHRCTGRTDIAIGTSIAGRRHADIERTVGLFINTLVMRLAIDPTATFRSLLHHARDVALAAYDHQDLPFEAVLEVLQPPRDLSRTPVFQTYFNLLNYNAEPHELPLTGLGEPRPTSAKFDLSLYATVDDDAVQLTLVYATALFEHDTAAALLSSLQHLVVGAVAEPDIAIGDLALTVASCVTPGARRPRRVPPIGPVIDLPETSTDGSIAARFEAVVAAQPDRPAVVTDTARWTYADLDERSRAIAAGLTDHSSAARGRIALVTAHDEGMVAAVLGVLRSGNAYVPVDPGAPLDRIADVLAHADVRAVVCDAASQSVAVPAATRAGIPVLALERLLEHRSAATLPAVAGDAVAYLLYTSGSTGRPKAVVQSHRNVVRHMRSYCDNLGIGTLDRLTLLSTYGFDASVMDIFAALVSGAALLPIDARAVGFDGVVDRIRAHQATVVHCTPTLFRGLAAHLAGHPPLTGMRAVVLGGEAVFRQDFVHFTEVVAPPCVFVNGYGPTEATVCTQFVADHATELLRTAVPIGLPLDGVDVRVIDEFGHDTPPGVPGELVVSSPQVALGYWRDEAATAATFRDLDGGAAREYRTGDRVRRQWDDVLVFEGRADSEVKVRGFRVDLKEVEAALLEVPGVREAAVTLDGGAAGTSLIAFVTSSWPERRLAADVRRHLRRKLPAYLVPSAIVWLDEMPQLATGKVDRAALQVASTTLQPDTSVAEPPLTPTERTLATIWSDVLGGGEIARSADFFNDLAGHSLAAMRIMARANEAFGVTVPLRAFFELPTIAALAARIDQQPARGPRPSSGVRAQARQVRRVEVDAAGHIRLVDDGDDRRTTGAGDPRPGDQGG